MSTTRLSGFLAFILLVMGCSNVKVNSYQGNQPELVLEDFFNGQLTAHGIVKNRSGKVIRYFNATIDASWSKGIGTLDEHFEFNDGELSQRVWTLNKVSESHYIGSASDVSGDGVLHTAGNSLFFDYVLQLPYKDGTINLRVDDRMYLVSERVLINESILSKWGFDVASITLTIVKHD